MIRTATLLLVIITIVALAIGALSAKERSDRLETTVAVKEFVRTACKALFEDKMGNELNSEAQLSRNGLSKMKPEFEIPKKVQKQALEVLGSSRLNALKLDPLLDLLEQGRARMTELAPDLFSRQR